MKRIFDKILRKRYYQRFASVGEGSLIPIKDRNNISGKEYVYIGRFCSIGPGCNINACSAGSIIIKDGTILAPNVTIFSRNHNYNHNLKKIPFDDIYYSSDVVIDEAGVECYNSPRNAYRKRGSDRGGGSGFKVRSQLCNLCRKPCQDYWI